MPSFPVPLHSFTPTHRLGSHHCIGILPTSFSILPLYRTISFTRSPLANASQTSSFHSACPFSPSYPPLYVILHYYFPPRAALRTCTTTQPCRRVGMERSYVYFLRLAAFFDGLCELQLKDSAQLKNVIYSCNRCKLCAILQETDLFCNFC